MSGLFRRYLRTTAAVLPLFLAACGKDEISTYRIPKESEPAMTAAGPAGPAGPEAPAAAAGGSLSWTVPTGWKPEPAGGMRFASFSVPAAGEKCELSVVRLPGDAGGALANVNRWRGQLGAAPLGENELRSLSAAVTAGAGAVVAVDIKGAGEHAGQAMAGAILSTEGDTWFFKLTGKEAAVAAARPSFLSFLKSLRPGPRS